MISWITTGPTLGSALGWPSVGWTIATKSSPPSLLMCRPNATLFSVAPKRRTVRKPSGVPSPRAADNTTSSPSSLNANGTRTPGSAGLSKCVSWLNTTNPPAAIVVPGAMTYLSGREGSSLSSQPPMSIGSSVTFTNSMRSPKMKSSVWANTSLTRIAPGSGAKPASSVPGEPPKKLLGRQTFASLSKSTLTDSSTSVSEKPSPSVIGNQSSS